MLVELWILAGAVVHQTCPLFLLDLRILCNKLVKEEYSKFYI